MRDASLPQRDLPDDAQRKRASDPSPVSAPGPGAADTPSALAYRRAERLHVRGRSEHARHAEAHRLHSLIATASQRVQPTIRCAWCNRKCVLVRRPAHRRCYSSSNCQENTRLLSTAVRRDTGTPPQCRAPRSPSGIASARWHRSTDILPVLVCDGLSHCEDALLGGGGDSVRGAEACGNSETFTGMCRSKFR
jgi:hypothetical protein